MSTKPRITVFSTDPDKKKKFVERVSKKMKKNPNQAICEPSHGPYDRAEWLRNGIELSEPIHLNDCVTIYTFKRRVPMQPKVISPKSLPPPPPPQKTQDQPTLCSNCIHKLKSQQEEIQKDPHIEIPAPPPMNYVGAVVGRDVKKMINELIAPALPITPAA